MRCIYSIALLSVLHAFVLKLMYYWTISVTVDVGWMTSHPKGFVRRFTRQRERGSVYFDLCAIFGLVLHSRTLLFLELHRYDRS